MDKRIIGTKVDIDYQGVAKFFDDRSANRTLKSKYNYVLFQDDNPELAIERDRAEKEKIGKVFTEGTSVLDIGCGIGRWGEYFLPRGINYTGIDASATMIERARENLASLSAKTSYKLYVGLAQDTSAVLREQGDAPQYDIILVNGVLMYLNDEDLGKTLTAINELAAPSATLYLKESMGLAERLTLNEIHSEALRQNYSAIYRSISEYEKIFSVHFGDSFDPLEQGALFADAMRNRKETLDYYFIFKR